MKVLGLSQDFSVHTPAFAGYGGEAGDAPRVREGGRAAFGCFPWRSQGGEAAFSARRVPGGVGAARRRPKMALAPSPVCIS